MYLFSPFTSSSSLYWVDCTKVIVEMQQDLSLLAHYFFGKLCMKEFPLLLLSSEIFGKFFNSKVCNLMSQFV